MIAPRRFHIARCVECWWWRRLHWPVTDNTIICRKTSWVLKCQGNNYSLFTHTNKLCVCLYYMCSVCIEQKFHSILELMWQNLQNSLILCKNSYNICHNDKITLILCWNILKEFSIRFQNICFDNWLYDSWTHSTVKLETHMSCQKCARYSHRQSHKPIQHLCLRIV